MSCVIIFWKMVTRYLLVLISPTDRHFVSFSALSANNKFLSVELWVLPHIQSLSQNTYQPIPRSRLTTFRIFYNIPFWHSSLSFFCYPLRNSSHYQITTQDLYNVPQSIDSLLKRKRLLSIPSLIGLPFLHHNIPSMSCPSNSLPCMSPGDPTEIMRHSRLLFTMDKVEYRIINCHCVHAEREGTRPELH